MLSFLFIHTATKEFPVFSILNPRVTTTKIKAYNFTNAQDAKTHISSIVGSDTADTLINKIRILKSVGTDKVSFQGGYSSKTIPIKGAAGAKTVREFAKKYNIVNLIKFNDGVIQVKGFIIISQVHVYSDTLNVTDKGKRTMLDEWRPLSAEQITKIYETVTKESEELVSNALKMVKTPEYKYKYEYLPFKEIVDIQFEEADNNKIL